MLRHSSTARVQRAAVMHEILFSAMFKYCKGEHDSTVSNSIWDSFLFGGISALWFHVTEWLRSCFPSGRYLFSMPNKTWTLVRFYSASLSRFTSSWPWICRVAVFQQDAISSLLLDNTLSSIECCISSVHAEVRYLLQCQCGMLWRWFPNYGMVQIDSSSGVDNYVQGHCFCHLENVLG